MAKKAKPHSKGPKGEKRSTGVVSNAVKIARAATGESVIPDHEWFVERLKTSKVSQREMSRRLGLDVAQVHKSLKGTRRFQIVEAIQIAHLLSVPLVEVLSRMGFEGVSPDPVKITGVINGDGSVSAAEGLGDAVRPPDSPPGTTALVFATEASPLAPFDGYTAYVVRTPGVDPASIGKLALIDAEDHPAPVLGILSKAPQRGLWKVRLAETQETFLTKKLRATSGILWMRSP